MADEPARRIYKPSPRHCEPITAENPGVKCPQWSVEIAQALLDGAEPVGKTLQATRDGVGFVAQFERLTDEGAVWHGYPEAWDRMDARLKRKWRAAGVISRKDLRNYRTRRQIRDEFGGRLVDG
jgi:hypothetical protein